MLRLTARAALVMRFSLLRFKFFKAFIYCKEQSLPQFRISVVEESTQILNPFESIVLLALIIFIYEIFSSLADKSIILALMFFMGIGIVTK